MYNLTSNGKTMEKTYYFAVDLGATSGRTILACYDDRRVVMREMTRFKNPMIPMNGHLYWDLPALYHEVLQGLRMVANEGIRLTSIGIDTWGCDVAFFSRDGRLASLPYCYRDGHTEGAMEKFFQRMPAEEVYGRTGIQFMPFNTLFQLDTLRRDGCEALEQADKVMFIPDALSYLLTGNAVTEYTVASTSQLLNPKQGALDDALLDMLGMDRARFGAMVNPGTVVGTLTPQVQEFTGLGAVPVVAVAGHDTASAVASVPAEDEHFAYLSCGTWSLLGIETPRPIISDDSFAYNFTNEGGLDGTTRFLKNICGLWLLERCRDDFEGDCTVAELTELSKTSDYEGLIHPDAPCFAHPVSMTRAIDAYCEQTGQEKPKGTADYCRCIFRSLALRYRQVLGLLQDLSPFSIERLHVIGGGSQNAVLMQAAADSTGLPVICGPIEGTALGNVLVQVRAAGNVPSLVDMRRIVANSVELVHYAPHHDVAWDAAYARFLALEKKTNP